MTALEQITDFVKSYPGADILQDFQIDYTDQIPNNGGAFPSGLVEDNRTEGMKGNGNVSKQKKGPDGKRHRLQPVQFRAVLRF